MSLFASDILSPPTLYRNPIITPLFKFVKGLLWVIKLLFEKITRILPKSIQATTFCSRFFVLFVRQFHLIQIKPSSVFDNRFRITVA